MEKKRLENLKGFYGKTTKAVKREEAIMKEMENDNATLTYLNTLEELPKNSKYASLDDWKAAINKQIKIGENALLNIELKKAIIEALDYFFEHNKESL